MTRRRWIADAWDDATASLHGAQAQHLSRVLRAQPGMEFDVVAGGRVWRGRIATVAEDSVRFHLLAELESPPPALAVTLLLSVFKFDRMEWAIEKAVELGCARILPTLAERTEKHLALAAAKRAERWRRIALEAAKQSRRGDLPEIAAPARLAELLAANREPEVPEGVSRGGAPLRILLSETEEDQTLLRILGARTADAQPEILLAVGPEGGWTANEIELFTRAGWQSVTLGPRILRVETAAIAALAIVNAAAGS